MSKIEVIKSLNSYSDGSEEYVLKVLQDSKDVSSNSDELQDKIKDWPTNYHLNRERLGVLFPIRLKKNFKVLEVGGGSGIITRYLAENVLSVVMLEGEYNRAISAQERTRDLENVKIIVGEVNDLDKQIKFDLIVIVGVLEYIGQKDSVNWLRSVCDLLEDDGTLILAIENRMGIKYFMGYPEDHTGNYWEGILDYQSRDKPRTYSKHELAKLLKNVGLPYQKWWYPFPDYKMPRTIINDQSISNLTSNDIASLIRLPFQNAGYESILNFNHKNLIKSITKSGIFDHLTNSLIVTANKKGWSKVVEEEALVISIDPNLRKQQFRRVNYLEKRKSSFFWRRELIYSKKENSNNNFIEHYVPQSQWIEGENLLDNLIKNEESLLPNLIKTLKTRIYDKINNIKLNIIDYEINPYLPNQICFKEVVNFFDVGIDNFILSEEEVFYIDPEWMAKKGACTQLIIFRAVYYLLANNKELWSNLNFENSKSLWDSSLKIVESIFPNFHHSTIDFLKAESWFMSQVTVLDVNHLYLNLEKTLSTTVGIIRESNIKIPLSDFGLQLIKNIN